MRVISGEYRSRRLYTLSKLETRPTLDHVKEGIFSHLADVKGKVFLDLFCGCGSIGIEAISRGAAFVVFNDKSFRAIKALKANIENLGIAEEKYRIINRNYLDTLPGLTEKFDVIYLDPPFNKHFQVDSLKLIYENDLLKDDGEIVIESESDEVLDNNWFVIKKTASYGRIKITYLTKKE